MAQFNLSGCTMLLVEDEVLIAMDLRDALEEAGATVHVCRSVREALASVDAMRFSAAVIDYKLGDGSADDLCQTLTRQGVPFVVYSGFRDVGDACSKWGVIPKPASAQVLVATVVSLLPAASQSARS